MLSSESGKLAASSALETRPSRRPVGTSKKGPFVKETASRAAKATISAQETTPGQIFSTAALASSMTANPSTPAFPGAAVSSPSFFNRMEPSQPCKSGKNLKKLGVSHEEDKQKTIWALVKLRAH